MVFDYFAKIFLALQHKLFYVVMSLGRFNLYANSYTYLYKKAFDTKRARGGYWAWRLEMAGLVFFWTWFGRVLYGCGTWQQALAYLLVSHVVTSPLHVQVSLFYFYQIGTRLNGQLVFLIRLSSHTLACPRETLDRSNHSPTGNCALLLM